jgi:succinyl-diaminopimelate desuccinylase
VADRHDDDVKDVCRRLIAAPSENPPGAEGPVADIVEQAMADAGFEVQRIEATPGRPNVVGWCRRGPGRRLILQAHLDTKPAGAIGPAGWSTDPFRAHDSGERMYGLGACDTKGGLAATLVAASRLSRRDDWPGELIVQGVADEEDGSTLGAAHLLTLGMLEADGAVVSEPTSCVPSIAQLGNAWAKVTVTGRAAHAGTPDRGIDAVRSAWAFVQQVDRYLADAPRSPAFPIHPRINVGSISGGGHPGTLPGDCTLLCDIRVMPGEAHDGTFSVYRTAAADVAAALAVSIDVEPYQGGGCESHLVGVDDRIVQAFDDALRPSKRSGQRCPFFGGSDARFFARAGTPAVVYGPGNLEQAHAPDEFVPLSELDTAAADLEATVLAFLRGSSARFP